MSLLLADGVGLGKTIQAGLVLEELLLRRRIRRVLVIGPAMLQRQWKYELRRKFNLDFEIIDSESTFQLRRPIGHRHEPLESLSAYHHFDGLPQDSRYPATVSPGIGCGPRPGSHQRTGIHPMLLGIC